MKNFLYFLSFTFLLISSCKKNNPPQDISILRGDNYYPLEIGKYIVYELDSIIWFEISGTSCIFGTDTSRSFLKEEIVDTYIDNSGTTNYILERFVRFNPAADWEIKDVWNIAKHDSKIERVEENFRFIKMIFPVAEGSRWDGNSFIDTDTSLSFAGNSIPLYKYWDNNYNYSTVDLPERINQLDLDSVATIIQSDTELNNVNNFRYSVEKYARNIGLVYKEMKIIESNCCGLSSMDDLSDCHEIPWEERAEKGFKLVQKVIDHN